MQISQNVNISEKEESLKIAYQNILDIGFGNLSLDNVSKLIDNDVMGYGTALDEKITSIDGFIELAINQRNQAKNFDDFRFSSNPVLLRFLGNGSAAIIIDEIELLTIIDNESNIMSVRMTAVMEYRNEGWKLVHWHSSLSEHVSGGEDPWHVNEWKKKNEELQKLVEDKTADLISKNWELEIESALERVRTSAMAMNKPADMLEVCRVISNQLELLGMENIRNVQTAIFNKVKKTYINYEYYRLHDKELVTEIDYTIHPKQLEWAEAMLKSPDSFFNVSFAGVELKEWIQNQKKSPQFIDSYLEDADSLNYYYFSIGPVAIGMSTYSPLTDGELKVFKRFKNVFELSYQRFLDIKQAESQTREAKIEAALERVRAKALAMRTSEELKEVASELRNQMGLLGQQDLEVCAIHLYEEDDEYFDSLGAMRLPESKGNIIQGRSRFPKKGIKIVEEMLDLYHSEQNDYVLLNEGEKAIEWLNNLQKNSPEVYNILSKKIESTPLEELKAYWAISDFSGGSLVMVTYNYPDENSRNLLNRSANVFDLAYKRFKDLKKAEAQARESQIELALEKVRAKTMAMQSSNELNEVVEILFLEFRKLGLDILAADIIVFHEQGQTADMWISGLDGTEGPYLTKALDHPHQLGTIEAWKKGDSLRITKLEGDYFRTFFELAFNETNGLKIVTQETKDWVFNLGIVYHSEAFTQHGCIRVSTVEAQSEDQINIQLRFAKVFNQTYRRFLDLKKSEKQAREAQIEAALERVRSRTMAMQNHIELAETASVLYGELVKIGLPHVTCAFEFIDADEKNISSWVTKLDGTVIENSFNFSIDEDPIRVLQYKSWKKKDSLNFIRLEGTERINHLKIMTQFAPESIVERILGLMPDPMFIYTANFSHGFIRIVTKAKLNEDQEKIIKRSSVVFEQTYIRFLDLKNSEEQNRIIQAENERKTKELEEARQLQLAMLPKELPNLSKLEIAAFMETATEVGGDYYDYSIKDNGSINICLGDATGHGLKAGTLVSMMKSLFVSESVRLDMKTFFNSANETLKKMSLNKMMIAFSMINIYGSKIKISSAGIPPVFIYRKKTNEIDEINLSGLPLGAMRNSKYEVYENELEKGDTILMFSDGMPELQNSQNEMYGYERLKSCFLDNATKSCSEIIGYLKKESNNWVCNKDLDDDITFVVIKAK